MKKIFKILLAVFIVFALAISGYLLYILKFKQYDVVDEEVDEILEEPYTLELPGDDDLGVDGEYTEDDTTSSTDGKQPASGELSSRADQTKNNVKQTTDPNSNKPSNNNLTAGVEQPTNKPTAAAIKQKYAPTFANLETQADAKLDALIGRAKSEYHAKKANGEKISYGYFYNEYVGAANALEANTDAAFHTVLSVVENDLSTHGYDPSYAQNFKDEYNAAKKARRDGILNKVTGL